MSEILSIKEMLKKIGHDPDFIIELEYKKCLHYVEILINRTEKSLIDIQESDGMNILSDRQKSVQKTLNHLVFAHNKMAQMEGIIYALTQENNLLKSRIKTITK